MRSARILCLCLTCGIPVLGLIGCSTHAVRSGTDAGGDSFAIKEGGRLFGHYCSPCHGEHGQGDGRYYASGLAPLPTNLTDPEFTKANGDEDLTQAISEGSASRGKSNLCPAWGATLTPAEIACLVEYIRHLQHESQGLAPGAFP